MRGDSSRWRPILLGVATGGRGEGGRDGGATASNFVLILMAVVPGQLAIAMVVFCRHRVNFQVVVECI